MTATPMVEARDRLNILSFLEDVRGTMEPNRQMLLDMLSGILTHEQGVGSLYWQYTQHTTNQELKEKWQRFGKETESHRMIAERVIGALGGDPSYKSSIARDHEKLASCFTNIESQGCAGDHVRLGNLVMTEKVSKLLWRGMHRLGVSVKDASTAKVLWDAARIVVPAKEEHLSYNTTMYESCLDMLSTS